VFKFENRTMALNALRPGGITMPQRDRLCVNQRSVCCVRTGVTTSPAAPNPYPQSATPSGPGSGPPCARTFEIRPVRVLAVQLEFTELRRLWTFAQVRALWIATTSWLRRPADGDGARYSSRGSPQEGVSPRLTGHRQNRSQRFRLSNVQPSKHSIAGATHLAVASCSRSVHDVSA
jgi:hypothetical protein